MAEVWLHDPRRLRADPRFAQQKAALRAQSIGGFVAADGRGLAARSQKIACGFEVCAAKPQIRGLRIGSEVCVCDPRIIAQKLGSEVCAAKS